MFIKYADFPTNNIDNTINKFNTLFVSSCGTYKLLTVHKQETCRPNGRPDYQLIYIASGKGYFYFNNSLIPTIINAGNFVLYHPYEFQKYEFFGEDKTEVFWIHFTGNQVAETFSKYHLDYSLNILPSGTSKVYPMLFEQVIQSILSQEEFSADEATLHLYSIIIKLARYNHMLQNNYVKPPDDILGITIYLQEHYQENISIDDIIRSKGYGVASFYRKFKAYTKLSPLQFLINLRLSNASKLLESTQYSISEIATLVGYDNPLYFSRIFCKHTGIPPSEYRQLYKNEMMNIS